MAIRRSFISLAVACSIFLQPSTVKAIDIADMFDVTVDAVRKIKAGDTYFHVRSLYDIPHTYLSEFSESTVRWVCERLCEGLADNKISAITTNKNLKTIDVKRIRYKIRYKYISDEYFGDPFNDYP